MIINCLAKYCLADCTELMGGSDGMLCFCSLNYKNSGDFCSLKYKNRMLFCSLKYKLYLCTVVQIQECYGKL